MAINYELINKGGISLGTNFELLSEKPLDSRLVVPSLDGLQNYIDSAAAYEGMIAYVTSEKKHYEVKVIDGVLSYRPFGLTEAELNDLITNATTAAMEFKGATAVLPENPAKGDMYKVAGENININIDEVDAKLGDSIVYDGTKWFLIPSGDDIEDTWRPVDGVNNDATLKFVDGDKTVAAVAADGTIKYNHATVAAPADVTAEGDEKTRTYITEVETDGYGHITGYKTATENVEDTNTEYTFESQVVSSSVYFNVTPNTEGATEKTIYVDTYSKNEADNKFVAKETGKSLVSDDEIARLKGVKNYDDKELRGLIGGNSKAIEDLEAYVGTIPTDEKYADITNVISYVNKKAEETLASAQGGSSETAASVKQQLDNYKSENDTRVKTAEDAIDAIEADYLKAADKTELANAIGAEKTRAEGIEAGLRTDVDAIKGDYLKAADIANFETKDNVNKVANDLAAETKARTDADAGFETRIAALESNFGDGEGTVEAQIAAAVAAEKKRAEGIEGGLRTDVNAVVGRMTTAENKIAALEGDSATHATKDELNAVDKKFEDYTKTADLPTDLGDFTNNSGYAKTSDVNIELGKKADKTQVATDIANAIAPLATTEDLNGVDAKFANYTNTTDMNAKFDLKADKSVVDAMYTNGQIDTAVQGAKDYAKGLVDAIPAQTDYTVTITKTTDGLASDVAKKYTFTQNGVEIGTINLAKELVVTSGSVKEVTVADAPYAGAVVGDKYIELVIANQDAPIYVPAKDLVDIYTAKDMTGIEGAEVQVAISNTNEISAALVNGGITEEKLDEDVKTKLNKTWEEVGVAAGLVEGLENGQVKANKEAIEKLNGADTVEGSVAKSIKDAITVENLGQYAKTADLGDLATLDTITANKVTDFSTEVAKVKVNEAAKADEAIKATQDGNGKVIADTYAEKATTLAGYGIGDAYTKTEIEALLTWGSF